MNNPIIIQDITLKKNNLFGFGIVVYGFANLLVGHPKDFLILLGHIFGDYFFQEYRSIHPARYVDTSLESRIIPQSGALRSYLSFLPFLVGSLGFLKWKFGNRVRQDVCLFMGDLKDLFSDAGFVFENAPTKLQYRQSPGIGLKVLHFFDRPRNCFPSLHVILASYSYLKTKELINKYSPDFRVHFQENNFLFSWSLKIIESCLLTKQHGLRDIAGGLAVISAKCPQFDRKDIEEIICLLFSDNVKGFPGDTISLARKEIESVYVQLMNVINSDLKSDYRSVLVNYIRNI
ncbi:MAG: hypothetical protein Q8R55_02065 [Candidatus Taylorbacteria bacterium]|nr:hypothetical protein [Candidatus Taylorbacteria bacterium]